MPWVVFTQRGSWEKDRGLLALARLSSVGMAEQLHATSHGERPEAQAHERLP